MSAQRSSAGCLRVLVLACLAAVAGCEGRSRDVSPPGPEPGDAAGVDPDGKSAGSRKPWPAEVGSISGVIRVAGNTPAMPSIDMGAAPRCVSLHGDRTPRLELIVAGEDRGLRDVFVYISRGLEGYEIPPVGPEPVVLDQKGCIYVPRVFGARVHQDIRILNSDPLLHNVKVSVGHPMNDAMPGPGEIVKRRWFARPQLGVSFQCEVHPWMKAYACVVDHPCHAVSDAEGRFTIANVPPGTFTIDFWHERAPGLRKPDPVEVDVVAGRETRIEASY